MINSNSNFNFTYKYAKSEFIKIAMQKKNVVNIEINIFLNLKKY